MSTAFTPVSALVGGVLIGASALLLYAGIGRIAGISGIVRTAVFDRDDRGWRIAFVVGLIVAASSVHWFTGWDHGYDLATPWWLSVPAGLLVGIGTAIGSGCTSGHGVCGVGRLSKRSTAATAIFLAFGVMTAVVIRGFLL